MVDEEFRSDLRVVGVADQVDGFLVCGYVPQLQLALASMLDDINIVDGTLTPSQANIRNSSMSGCITVSVV